jgi:hypothetical protein
MWIELILGIYALALVIVIFISPYFVDRFLMQKGFILSSVAGGMLIICLVPVLALPVYFFEYEYMQIMVFALIALGLLRGCLFCIGSILCKGYIEIKKAVTEADGISHLPFAVIIFWEILSGAVIITILSKTNFAIVDPVLQFLNNIGENFLTPYAYLLVALISLTVLTIKLDMYLHERDVE